MLPSVARFLLLIACCLVLSSCTLDPFYTGPRGAYLTSLSVTPNPVPSGGLAQVTWTSDQNGYLEPYDLTQQSLTVSCTAGVLYRVYRIDGNPATADDVIALARQNGMKVSATEKSTRVFWIAPSQPGRYTLTGNMDLHEHDPDIELKVDVN